MVEHENALLTPKPKAPARIVEGNLMLPNHPAQRLRPCSLRLASARKSLTKPETLLPLHTGCSHRELSSLRLRSASSASRFIPTTRDHCGWLKSLCTGLCAVAIIDSPEILRFRNSRPINEENIVQCFATRPLGCADNSNKLTLGEHSTIVPTASRICFSTTLRSGRAPSVG